MGGFSLFVCKQDSTCMCMADRPSGGQVLSIAGWLSGRFGE